MEEGKKILEALKLRHEWHEDFEEGKLKEIDKLMETNFFEEYKRIIKDFEEEEKEILECEKNDGIIEEEIFNEKNEEEIIEEKVKERIKGRIYITELEELNDEIKRYLNFLKYEYMKNNKDKYSKEMKEISEGWKCYFLEKEKEKGEIEEDNILIELNLKNERR